jgi:hypothetical protein
MRGRSSAGASPAARPRASSSTQWHKPSMAAAHRRRAASSPIRIGARKAVSTGRHNASLCGGCDDESEAWFERSAESASSITWTAERGEAGGSAAMPAGDRGGAHERGCGSGRGYGPGEGRDGLAGRAACHHRIWRREHGRPRGAIWRSPSARRSRCFALKATDCGRSPGGLTVADRRSRASCGGTRPPAPAAWGIEPPLPNGVRNGLADDRARRSPNAVTICAAMSRMASSAQLRVPTVGPGRDRMCPGRSAVRFGVSAGGEARRGPPRAGFGQAQDRLPRGRDDAHLA